MSILLHVITVENSRFVTQEGIFQVLHPEIEDNLIVNEETGEIFEVLASETDETGALQTLTIE